MPATEQQQILAASAVPEVTLLCSVYLWMNPPWPRSYVAQVMTNGSVCLESGQVLCISDSTLNHVSY